jgi:hypothetical protein
MKRHQPALLGGLFIGVLSSLPLVSAVNLCCCLWVVIGGGLTVYLQQQSRPEPVEAGEAVLGGLLAGLVGAVISGLVTFVLFSAATGMGTQEEFRQMIEQNPGVPPEAREMLNNLFQGGNFAILLFAVNIPVYAVFSMLGALLGLAIFKKKTPPAPPQPEVPTFRAPGV